MNGESYLSFSAIQLKIGLEGKQSIEPKQPHRKVLISNTWNLCCTPYTCTSTTPDVGNVYGQV